MKKTSSSIVGIDLGTPNSEIAAYLGDKVEILGPPAQGAGGSHRGSMLASCVGLAPDGQLLVGEAARNQLLVYPERTVRSIKRKMGTQEKVTLGDETFTPQEISALILRELAGWGAARLGHSVEKAVITVPAYFSDAQRQATREAGKLAGLEVMRILNEPTAASLAYGYGQTGRETTLIYDLGGGTFDISIVSVERDVTEVLASHGNNQLGGDDFDQLILDWLVEQFKAQHKIDLSAGHPNAYARLRWAAEEAKKDLSFEPYSRIRQESLVQVKGKSLHLDVELARADFESMIAPLLDSTPASLAHALESARLRPADLNAILLVGGSTRIPMVSRLLHERTGKTPRQDVNPDLCVALGAGVLASRLAGHDVGRVLVDVSPYAFGPSFLGIRNGEEYPYCYKPIIQTNTPLPVTRTELYLTSYPHQEEVLLQIFQGEDPDALKNVPLGEFRVEGLRPKQIPNEVLCRMSLDLDGILQVTAIEKDTGLSKHISIEGAFRRMSDDEVAIGRQRLSSLCGIEEELVAALGGDVSPTPADEESPIYRQALELVLRARKVADQMHTDDAQEAAALEEQIQQALDRRDEEALSASTRELSELLFFVESAKS